MSVQIMLREFFLSFSLDCVRQLAPMATHEDHDEPSNRIDYDLAVQCVVTLVHKQSSPAHIPPVVLIYCVQARPVPIGTITVVCKAL